MTSRFHKAWPVAAILACAALTAQTPDPKVLSYKLPNEIPWQDGESGVKTKVLYGDPSKPGLYIVLAKWEVGKMSRPHWHPNDRYITVLSGTWWMGTGSRFDPNSTTPAPPGTFVTHFAHQVHYDGAKDEEVILQIVGMGPATSTPAE
jgi:quercetin dioxygenase-like cupin family protein